MCNQHLSDEAITPGELFDYDPPTVVYSKASIQIVIATLSRPLTSTEAAQLAHTWINNHCPAAHIYFTERLSPSRIQFTIHNPNPGGTQ